MREYFGTGEGMKRRQFIRSAVSSSAMVLTGRALAGLAMSRGASQSRSADSRIEVLLDEPIGRIVPEIYGHFAEHLGGVVYGGIWVGEDSKTPKRRRHSQVADRRVSADYESNHRRRRAGFAGNRRGTSDGSLCS